MKSTTQKKSPTQKKQTGGKKRGSVHSPLSRNKLTSPDVRIDEFLTNAGISPSELSYDWMEENEIDVIKRFRHYHSCITEALRNDSEIQLDCCIESIVTWGDAPVKKQTRKRFASLLQALNVMGDDAFPVTFEDQRLTVDPSCPICYEFVKISTGNVNRPESNPPTPLSSWTKVLAAYAPERFWIYDSRVAVALCFLYRDVNWFIPSPHNKAADNLKKVIDKDRLSDLPEKSYKKYLELLKDVRNQGRCEKKLFMLGGVLRDRFAADNTLWSKAMHW